MLGRLVFSTPSTDPAGGLFRTKQGMTYLEFNPDVQRGPRSRRAYRAAGRLLAYSLTQRLPLGVPLPAMFFVKLLNGRVSMADVEHDDVELHRNLQRLLDGGEVALRAVLMMYGDEAIPTVDAYVADQLNELIPAAHDWRIDEMRTGFAAAVDVDALAKNIAPTDLRYFVYGDPTISVADLRAHTRFNGNDAAGRSLEHAPEVGWLWSWLEEANNGVRRQFVRFVTGLPQLPLGGAAKLEGGGIRIARSFVGDLAPRSHTCFNTLDLPRYTSRAQLVEWMSAAVASDGFGSP
jgi:hypothetical protein